VQLLAEDISKENVDGYWGYDVQFADSLSTLLESTEGEVLMTSVEGSQFTRHVNDLMIKIKESKNLLVVFGGPKFGLRKILECENKKISSNNNLMNMFPMQGTQTVRFEEAILGTLSIINNYLHA
jgi:predicted SPOUT superfamily RNA methylase MTH1